MKNLVKVGLHPVSGKEFFVCNVVNGEYVSCFGDKNKNPQGFPTRILAEKAKKECKNVYPDDKFYIIKKSNILRIADKPLLWEKQYDEEVKRVNFYNRDLKHSLQKKDLSEEAIKNVYNRGKLDLPERNCPHYLVGTKLLNLVK